MQVKKKLFNLLISVMSWTYKNDSSARFPNSFGILPLKPQPARILRVDIKYIRSTAVKEEKLERQTKN